MNGYLINILYHTEETRRNKDLDIEFDWRELDVVPFLLLNFHGAHPVWNNEIEYTEIYIGGSTIITLMTFDEFQNLIL
jgi:hypothetical protein